MASPDVQGTKTTKRHPACPGRSRCQIKGCIHNSMSSMFSTVGVSHVIHEVNGMLIGAHPSVQFGGWLYQYQRPDNSSEGTNVSGINDITKETTGTMVYAAQMKIRDVSGIVLDRIRSFFNVEMPV